MKKSIKNKIYDTEKAKKIGEYKPQSLDIDDLGYYEECLYQKRTGEFFLYGSGNSESCYKKETITPLAYEEAKDWAEKCLSQEKYKNVFGVLTNDDKYIVSMSLRRSTHKKLKQASAKVGKNVSEFLDDLLQMIL